ncbi:hypothetical protein BU17DRAFT_64167 [Hysterangium stoloniferum]|nr:hypothetical protein BU17DRAFT_64167 [Hysterangium stoloniferum]
MIQLVVKPHHKVVYYAKMHTIITNLPIVGDSQKHEEYEELEALSPITVCFTVHLMYAAMQHLGPTLSSSILETQQNPVIQKTDGGGRNSCLSSSTDPTTSNGISKQTLEKLPQESILTVNLYDALGYQLMIEMHHDETPPGITYLDIIKGSGPEVEPSSEVELHKVTQYGVNLQILCSGRLVPLIWGSSKLENTSGLQYRLQVVPNIPANSTLIIGEVASHF